MRISLLIFTILSLASCKKDGMVEFYLKANPKTQAVNKVWNDWRGRDVIDDGDSFTFGYGVGDTRSYPTVFSQITGLQTINKGMPGKYSYDIRDRFLLDPQDFDKPHIIWAGRNNNWSTQQILDDVAAMVEKIQGERYLIVGLLSGDWPGEYLQDTTTIYGTGHNMHYWTTTFPDSLLTIQYGEHMFSPQPFFLSQPVTCTQDSIDKSHGIVYARFRSDALHLNEIGYAMLADTLSRRIVY